MNLIIEPEIQRISFGKAAFTLALKDGRILSVPYSWFPRLQQATPQERRNCHIWGSSISWEELDEDIHIDALLAGKPDSSAFAREYWSQHPEDDPRPYLTVSEHLELSLAEAAKRMNISRQRLTVLVQQGRIPARRFGKQYLIHASDLNRLTERKVGRPRKSLIPT